MLKSLLAAFALPELRQRIQFVFIMFGVFIIGLHIQVPGIDRKAMENLVNSQGILQLFDTFSGAAFRKWVGEVITERGIGPVVRLVIFCSIMARLPYEVSRTLKGFSFEPGAQVTPWGLFLLLALFLGMVVSIIFVSDGVRRIPIQHA